MSSPADFGEQSRDARGDRGSLSTLERRCCIRNMHAAECKFSAREFSPGDKGRGNSVATHIHSGQRLFGGLKFADEQVAASADQAGVDCIGAVSERVQRFGSGVEFVNPPAEIASGEGNFGLSYLATGLGKTFPRAKVACGVSEEFSRPRVIA